MTEPTRDALITLASAVLAVVVLAVLCGLGAGR